VVLMASVNVVARVERHGKGANELIVVVREE